MFTAAELACLRDTQASVMPETVIIQRPTSVSDGAGGFTDTYATQATVAGRLQAVVRDGNEGEVGQRVGAITSYNVLLPYGTAVLPKDRLLIGSRTFEVQGVLYGSYETVRTCLCSEIV